MEEVNTNGFMVGDNNVLYKAQQDTVDLLRVLGADGWPKRPLYAEHAASMVNDFLKDHNVSSTRRGGLESHTKLLAAHRMLLPRVFHTHRIQNALLLPRVLNACQTAPMRARIHSTPRCLGMFTGSLAVLDGGLPHSLHPRTSTKHT